MSAVEDIRNLLEQRLTELDEEIESLRCALTALDDEELAARAPEAAATAQGTVSAPEATALTAPRTRRRTARQPRASASADGNGGADGASSAELERQLAQRGGLTAVELARQTGTDYAAVLARIRQLEEAGQGRR